MTCEHFLILCNVHSRKKEIPVEYCLTHILIADYFTLPLQGKALKTFCDFIMGYTHINAFLTADIPIKDRD